ncbi:MAG TPA: hypothetical protein VHV83_15050 [Armatimonadota bacterium]|nr:hypothetical protein [Armatimonadota bacterium]
MSPLLPDHLDFAQPRCSVRESTLAGARALVLDNGIFCISLLPEFGGRLCSLFYRPLNHELLATEFLRGQRNNLSVRGGWCSAFPSLLADGEIASHQSWEAELIEHTEKQIVVRLWCLVERVSHVLEGQTRVTPGTVLMERFIRLQAGEAAVVVEDVLTNRNVWPLPTTWSGVVALRAQPGDRAIVPVENVEVQRGVGPSGNELDFGLLVTTPYQAFARNLSDGWIGFRPSSVPVDIRLSFPREVLPHAVIAAQRDEHHHSEGVFRLQPIATPSPIADDTRGGALLLPPKQPVRLPIRLEAGAGMITAGEWSRPGLQLAELITEQHIPSGRIAVWRVADAAVVIKTPRQLVLLMPEYGEEKLMTPEDIPAADLILFDDEPPRAVLRQLVQRTSARFLGPSSVRQLLLTDGVADDRSVTLSPGARFDLPGFNVLATPARNARQHEHLGYIMQIDHLSAYHLGATNFLGEFGPIGEQFHPQLVFIPLGGGMSMADCIHAAKILQPRIAVPLGTEEAEEEFIQRCRNQHMPFAAQRLSYAEGCFFDGWRLKPLG